VTGEGGETPSRGRAREQAILSAVVGLLGEVGYEAMTMDAVAARAHASKTTIYRRWPGKPELVRSAVGAFVAGRVLAAPDAGTLRGDLLAVMQAMRGHLTPEFTDMMSGLVHAMRSDPELAGSLRSLFAQDPVSEQIVGRAVARGEVQPGAASRLAPLVHEAVEAQLLRQIFSGGELDDAFARHVIDDVVLPLVAGSVAQPKSAAKTKGTRLREQPDEKTGAATPLTTFDTDELESFTRAFEELFNEGDPKSMTSYYTEDAQLMAEGIEPLHGRAAIDEFWRVAISRATAARARRTIRLHESSSSGDLGYALCTVTVEIPPGPGATGAAGASISVGDATIWHRDKNGQWRIAVDISTPLPSN
jgi:AcrR family transcriptional regulator/ketosteroid isomerase-like protein